jgi:hypothetical protein
VNIQCTLCKEIVPLRTFSSTTEGVTIQCGECRGAFFVASQPPTARKPIATPVPVEPDGCPKCDQPLRPGTRACDRCGLSAGKFATFASGATKTPVALQSLWQQCERDWSNPDAHRRFLEAASEHDNYTLAAKHYRRALRERPDDSTARDALDRISTMVTARALSTSRSRGGAERAPFRAAAAMMLVLLLGGAVGGIYVIGKRPATAPQSAYSHQTESSQVQR